MTSETENPVPPGVEQQAGETVTVEMAKPQQQLEPSIPKPIVHAGGPIQALIPRDLDETFRLAGAIWRSRLAPYGFDTPEKIMVAIMKGLEIGLPPMQALDSIAVINGKASLYGDVGLALINASGLLEDFEERYTGAEFEDDFTAVCIMKRVGRPKAVTNTYSVKDARKAGYWEGMHIDAGPKRAKSPWVTNPKRMLRWRARWFTMRDLFSDVLKNMPAAEEMQDVEPIDVTPAAARPASPTQDIGARLAAGIKPTIAYVDGKPASAPVGPKDAAGARTPAAGDEAAPDATGGQEPSSDMQSAAEFEAEVVGELTAALMEAQSPAAVRVVADEFAGAMQVASIAGERAMQVLIDKRMGAVQ